MEDDRYPIDPGWEEPDEMAPVYRAPTYSEASAVLETLRDHGLECELAREAGSGYAELTDHFAEEEMASFVVMVRSEDAEAGERLVEQLGLVGMMDPAHMEMGQKRWVRGCDGALAVGFIVFMVAWCVMALLHLLGWIDFP